jgi:membrane protease YdiL (CAAX protease family)
MRFRRPASRPPAGTPQDDGMVTAQISKAWTGARGRIWRRPGLPAAVTILAAANVVVTRIRPGAAVAVNLAAAALLLLVARRSGASWDDMGLGSARLRRGLLIGAGVAGAVGMVYLVGLALPATRELFVDERAGGPLSGLLWQVMVGIPLGTIVLEEVAFRGVLPALVGGSFWRGAMVSSALFGLWHVLPAIGLGATNVGVGSAIGELAGSVQVGLVVLGTSAAGLLLVAQRRWSGHLVTPALAHLATNVLGALIAWRMIMR